MLGVDEELRAKLCAKYRLDTDMPATRLKEFLEGERFSAGHDADEFADGLPDGLADRVSDGFSDGFADRHADRDAAAGHC